MKHLIRYISLISLTLAIASCSLVPPGSQPTATPLPAIPPSGYEPKEGDNKLKRDQVFLDVENSQLIVMESYPIQVNVNLKGNLPDPCHELRVAVTPANAKNEIYLDVYSVVDSSKACITVLQPFEASIALGSYANGHYLVYVNNQLLGEFDA